MRRLPALGIVLAVCGEFSVAAAGGASAPPQPAPGPPPAFALVGSSALTAERLARRVGDLTRPEWKGRAPGSAGADSSASYIEGAFREAGLQPVGPEGSMRFETPLSSAVRIQGAVGLRDERHGYTFGRDYWPQGFSTDGEVLSTLVFAGYGIRSPETGYDDYAGLDVQGKVVVVMSGEPGISRQSSGLFPEYPSWSITPFGKARLARELGAAAVLFLTAPAGAGPTDRPWAVPQDRAHADAGILACHLSGAAGESLLSTSGIRLADLQAEIDRTLRPRSRDLPEDSVQVLVNARRLPGSAVSVAAMLPGRTSETWIVAACFDGYGSTPPQPDPVICPGAIDNASGAAALLEIARAMRDAPASAKTICFLAYAGRDLDGIGFDTFLEKSGLDRARIAGVVDLAALGRPQENRLYAVGDQEAFGTALRRVNDLLSEPCEVRWRAPAPPGTLPRRLAEAGIPAMGLSSGHSPEFGTPEDTPDLLDPAAAVPALRLAYGLIRALAGEEP